MVGSFIREVQTIYTFLFPPVHIPRWDEDQVTVSFYLEARRPCAIGQPVPVSTSFFVCRNLTWSLLRYLPPIQLFIFFFFPLIFYPLCFSDGRRSAWFYFSFDLNLTTHLPNSQPYVCSTLCAQDTARLPCYTVSCLEPPFLENSPSATVFRRHGFATRVWLRVVAVPYGGNEVIELGHADMARR